VDEPLVMDPELAGSPALADRAEAVRDYLVAVRGGAPFLSAVDERLLVGWLSEGVPVLAIAAAIDAVAERRRRRRARGRMGLSSCTKELGKQAAAPPVDSTPSSGRLAGLLGELRAMAVDASLEPERAALCAELQALDSSAAHPDELGRAAALAIRGFHAAAWVAASAEHGALRAQAEALLEPLRSSLAEAEWAELVEEQARDLLRRRFPAVSAKRVWDTLSA